MRDPVTLTRPDSLDVMTVRATIHPDGGGDWAVITDQTVLGGLWASIVTRESDNPADADDDLDTVVRDAVRAGWIVTGH